MIGIVSGPLLVVSCICVPGSLPKYKNIHGEIISPRNHLAFLLLQRTTDNDQLTSLNSMIFKKKGLIPPCGISPLKTLCFIGAETQN